MTKMMTDRFHDLEASLATTQAALVSLGNQIEEVENASSDNDRCPSIAEQTCTKMQSENEALLQAAGSGSSTPSVKAAL